MIYLLHGAAHRWKPRSFAYRSVVAIEALEQLLTARSERFVDLEESLVRGDALTVDDATRGGAAVCRLAKSLGHDVTFFVNPFNIDASRPYFFTTLNIALDLTARETVRLSNRTFALTDWRARRDFRTAAKRYILEVAHEDEMQRRANEVRDVLGVETTPIPDHLQTLTRAELLELRDMGVRIESHGWTHIEIAHASSRTVAEHLELAREWLRDECGTTTEFYAIPFGETELQPPHATRIRGRFLADYRMPGGRIAERCWNRVDLDVPSLAS